MLVIVRRTFAASVAVGCAIATWIAACASFDATDTAPADAAVSEAAATDGAGERDADAGEAAHFCERFVPDAGSVVYCRDFDDGKPIADGWATTAITSGASFAIDDVTSLSPPASLFVSVPADSGDCAYARGVRPVGNIDSPTTVAFDVRIGGADAAAFEGVSYMAISFTGINGFGLLIVSTDDVGTFVKEQTTGKDNIQHPLVHFPTPGIWTHMELKIDPTTRVLRAFVDGQEAFTTQVVLTPTSIAPGWAMEIWPGIHCTLPSANGREAHLDDIVVTR